MDRDEVALALGMVVCGALLLAAAVTVPATRALDERRMWRRLWLPALPAGLAFFVLLGWAASDPEDPQPLAISRVLALMPWLLVWGRVVVRAVRRLRSKAHGPAVVRGILRPRVEVSDQLRAALTPGELRAVLAHEEAHIQHRDPLRIWLGNVITDMQWPVPSAQRRYRNWAQALELARDAEAVAREGVEPTDLASAIIKAARFPNPPTSLVAALADDASFLETRIHRLLTASGRDRPHRPDWSGAILSCLAIGAFVVGVLWAHPIMAIVAGSP